MKLLSLYAVACAKLADLEEQNTCKFQNYGLLTKDREATVAVTPVLTEDRELQ